MTGLKRFVGNVGRLGVKELWSLRREPVLLFLVVYAFGFAVYSAAEDAAIDVENAAVAVVDEDRSPLSRRLRDALREPHFREPVLVEWNEVDPAMEAGRYTFTLVIPARFEADILARRSPALQLHVDATAISTAGRGALYVESIVEEEVARYLSGGAEGSADPPIRLVARARFNPNLESRWFQGVIEVVSNITFLALILAGAAVIREREHGTLEHLLLRRGACLPSPSIHRPTLSNSEELRATTRLEVGG